MEAVSYTHLRSSEVWKVLGAVKTEFNNFEKILKSTQDKLLKANDELDKLVGVRTRAIQRKLKNVESLDTEFSEKILEMCIRDRYIFGSYERHTEKLRRRVF